MSASQYAVMEASRHDSVNWDDVQEEQGYERWSRDGSKFIIEFTGEIPGWASEETILNQSAARQQVIQEF